MQRPPQGSPPAGWYPQSGGQRYWDGVQWTQHTAPLVRSSGSNTWAVMSHLPIGGFIIPLLALLIEGPKDDFVKHHSTESLNFHITTAIVALAGTFPILFGLVTGGVEVAVFLLVWSLLFLGPIIFGIMGMISASKGGYYRYPVAFRFIKGPTPPAK
jgi:uncharacterized protein